ncbi:MAG: SagB/ThcOx family dehydrogenase [bacterium]
MTSLVQTTIGRAWAALLLSLLLALPAVAEKKMINLPPANTDGTMSLEKALVSRRSVRSFTSDPLNLQQVSQLLWAAQGMTPARENQTSPPSRGYRTAPSAGALYPLELYIVVQHVQGLDPGVYHYDPKYHTLEQVAADKTVQELSDAALGQESMKEAAICVVITSVASRLEAKYRDRAWRYAAMESGHAAQNLLLEATALGLGAVPAGAFQDNLVKQLLGVTNDVFYILPVGYAAE